MLSTGSQEKVNKMLRTSLPVIPAGFKRESRGALGWIPAKKHAGMTIAICPPVCVELCV
jgi:hypothetical protein